MTITAHYIQAPKLVYLYGYGSSNSKSLAPAGVDQFASEPACTTSSTFPYEYNPYSGYYNENNNVTTYGCEFDAPGNLLVVELISQDQLQPSQVSITSHYNVPLGGTVTSQFIMWLNKTITSGKWYAIGEANFTSAEKTFNDGGPMPIPSVNQGDVFNLTASNDLFANSVSALGNEMQSVADGNLNSPSYCSYNATMCYLGDTYVDISQALNDMITSIQSTGWVDSALGAFVATPGLGAACGVGIAAALATGAMAVLTGGTAVIIIAGLVAAGVTGVTTYIYSC